MKIALDFDNTYTKDPAFWDAMIAMAGLAGHEIRIVTARDDRHDRTNPLVAVEKVLPVIYCRGAAKRWYCTHHTEDAWVPDIWIDDKPESILDNSASTPEQLVEWRSTREEGPSC